MKKLFFSLLALIATLSVNAQVEPTNGGVYYLYNTESDMFLSRGQSWGTQAVGAPVGMPWQVTVQDGKYKLQMKDLLQADQTNRHLGTNGFSDNDAANQVKLLTATGDASAFTLDMSVNDNKTINVNGSSTWQFLTQEQYTAKLAAKAATQEASIATSAGIDITGTTLADVLAEYRPIKTNDGIPTKATWPVTGVGNRGGNQNEGNYGEEIYQGGGRFTKTITGLKPGVYKLKVRAQKRVGTNANCYTLGEAGYPISDAYMNANGFIIPISSWYEGCDNNGSPNSTGRFVEIVATGKYTTEGFVYVGEDGQLKMEAISEAYWNLSWFLFNGVEYTYYSNEVTAEDVDALIATVPTGKMDATVKSNLDAAVTALQTDATIPNYKALQSAIETANASVAAYAAAKKIADGAKAKATAAAVELNSTAFDTAYEAGTLTGNTEAEALMTAVNTTIDTKLAGCTDKTTKIVNPSFEDGKLTGWTNVGFGNPATNKNWGDRTGDLFMEKWTPAGGKLANGSLTQTIANLPIGEYILTVDAKNEQQSGTTAETGFFAVIGDKKYEVNSNSVDHCTVSFSIDTKSDITIGVELDGCTGNWVCFDNFQLFFNGIDPSGLEEAIAAATTLYNSYDSEKQYAIDLKAAIDAAQAAYDEGFTSVETLNAAVSALQTAINTAKHAARVETYAQIEDGKYVLSLGGRFLGAGNAWGTQASLLAHPEYVELAKLADGKYTIKSQVSNGNGKNFFNGEYMDGVATGIEIIATDGGYYLSDGVKYYFNNNGVVGSQDESVKWTIKSLAEMDAEIDNATDENPYDITYKLVDPNFGRNNIHAGDWERTNVDRKGVDANNLYEAYKKTFSISQTVENLPAGYYVVKATGLYRQDGEDAKLPYVFANSEKADFIALDDDLGADAGKHAENAAALMAQGKYEISVRVLVSNGTLELGAATEGTSCWALFDNFQLYAVKRGLPANEADYAALNAAIADAEAKTIGFLEGEYAERNNVEALKALADAKAVDQAIENPQDAVQALTDALTNAVWTVNAEEINAIDNGDFEGSYAAVSGSGVSSDRDIFLPEGWSFRKNGIDKNDIVVLKTSDKAGNNVTSITSLENGGNNTIMYRGKWGTTTNLDFYQKITLPAGTYYLECDAWKSGLGGDAKIYVGNDNNASLDGNDTSWRKLSLTFTLDEKKTVEVGFNIKHTNDGSEKFIGFDNFVLKTAAEATLAVKAEKYGTFIAPFDATLPKGVELYTCAEETDGVLTLTDATKIEAGKPYITKSTGEAVEKTFYGKATVTETTCTEGMLTGVLTTGQNVPAGRFILSTKDGVQGFYKVATDSYEAAKNKCYITMPADSEVRTALFFEGDATAIQTIEALTSGDAKIYDLSGRQLKSLQKGINIVNGKTVLVK